MKTHFLKDSIKRASQLKTTDAQQIIPVLVAPRTTVQPFVSQEKTQLQRNKQKQGSILEQFNTYTSQILPKMQKSIELNLIQQLFQNIKDQKIQEQISQAYLRRQVIIFKQSLDQKPFEDIRDILSSQPKEQVDVLAETDILHHTEEDIGKYNIFPLKDFQKYFKHSFYGDYVIDEFRYSKKFALMCTQEGLKIVNDLRKIKPLKAQDYLSENYLNKWDDEEVYPLMFQYISNSFITELQKFRSSVKFQRLFSMSSVFDTIVQILLFESKQNHQFAKSLNKNLSKAFNDILTQLEQKADPALCNPQLVDEFLQNIQTLELNLGDLKTTIDLQKYAGKENRYNLLPESLRYGRLADFQGFNSGVMLYGERGTGKSGVLGYVSMWAFKSDWIVISVPNVYKWVNDVCDIERHNASGLFLQNDFAVEFLEQVAQANQEKFEKIPVNQTLYGKMNIAGVHQNDVEPVPNLYDKERKVYFKEHEKFLFEEEKKYLEEEDREMNITMGEKFPNPQTLMDIVQYGIKNKNLATCAVYELLEQLYNLESHSVLVAVDSYNLLFRPSKHPSFRYVNDRKLKGCIPPYHLALCRAFINFDGHKIKNGFKICASSNKQLFRHNFNPEKIMFNEGYSAELNGLPLDDYRYMMEYYYQNLIWLPNEDEKYSYEQYWMENQGNWHQTFKVMTGQMRDV